MNLVQGLSLLADLRGRFDSATDQARDFADQARDLKESATKGVMKGLLAHSITQALVFSSTLLLLGGTAWGLAVYVHPALAAVIVGGTVLAAVITVAALAIRSR